MQPRKCALPDCNNTFIPPKSAYWKLYCCPEHRLIAFALRREAIRKNQPIQTPAIPFDIDDMLLERDEELKAQTVATPNIEEAKQAIARSGMEATRYAPDEPYRPAYPKIEKEREDAKSAQQKQQENQHSTDVASSGRQPGEAEAIRGDTEKSERKT